jgi:hypothetical protein
LGRTIARKPFFSAGGKIIRRYGLFVNGRRLFRTNTGAGIEEIPLNPRAYPKHGRKTYLNFSMASGADSEYR